ncbi:MAG: copper resistance protein NlpE N-terminal domain-containing protein [Luteimonas sp.]
MRLSAPAPLACFAAVLACLTACDANAPLAPPLPQIERGDGRIAWQGALACADCDGIDTQLVLERAGNVRSYALTETFRSTDGGAQFAESGRWQRVGDLIRMQGDGGSLRAYALMPDGSLQPRDPRGRRFPDREGDVLLPVTADNAP